MNSLLKNAVLMAMLMFCTISNAQDFSYYIEIDKKLTPTTKDNFEKSIDHHINVDVYLENDKRKIAVLYVRQREGKLTSVQLEGLKRYLKEIGKSEITANEYIIIDYRTSVPISDTIGSFDFLELKNYSRYEKKLRKRTSCKNYTFYNKNGRNSSLTDEMKKVWFPDENEYILKLLFPAEANYGNAAVIRPDGTFMTYIGEYGHDEVYKMIDKLKG